MNLFVVLTKNNKVCIKEVSVVKETEKQVFLKCEGISRQKISKDAIGTYLKEGHLYAHSPEEALKLWNKHHKELAESLRSQADLAISLITEEDASKLVESC